MRCTLVRFNWYQFTRGMWLIVNPQLPLFPCALPPNKLIPLMQYTLHRRIDPKLEQYTFPAMYKMVASTPSLLILILLAHQVQSCATFITPNCNFLFTGPTCIFQACTTPSQDPNGSSFRSSNWSYCISLCCQTYRGPDYPPYIQTLDSYCSAADSSRLPLGATVAIALGFVLFIVLTVGICIYLKLVTCACPCLGRNRRQGGQREDARHAPSQVEIAPVEKKREEIFVTEQLFEQRGNQRVCSICLNDETNVSTKCGHFFHAECLYEWLKRRQTCPECRMQGLDGFLLYCSQCQKNYQKIGVLKEKEEYECKYCKL